MPHPGRPPGGLEQDGKSGDRRFVAPTTKKWLHSCMELANEWSLDGRSMLLDWQVIAMGCGALVLTVMTGLRSKAGAAPEQSGNPVLHSEDAIKANQDRGELAQKLRLDLIRIR